LLTVGQAAGDGSQFSGGVSVNAGGILRGTGAIAPPAGSTVFVAAGGSIMGGQSGSAAMLTLSLPARQSFGLSGTLAENVSGTVAPDTNGLSPGVSRIGLTGGGLALSNAGLTLDFSGIGSTGGISNDPDGDGNGFWTDGNLYNDSAHAGFVWRVIDAGTGTIGTAPAVTNPTYATGIFSTFIGTGGPLTLTDGGDPGAVYLAFTHVPEPSTIVLVGAAGLAGLGWRRGRPQNMPRR
jgi:hypothetical protein